MPSALEQWAFDHQWPPDDEDRPRCLECGNFDYEGHTKDCALGLALSDAGFPVEWYIGPMHGPWPPLSAAALNVTPTEWGFAAVIADRVKSMSSLSHLEALAPEQRGEER